MDSQKHSEIPHTVTRRTLLRSAAAVATARTIAAQTTTAKTTLVYVGAYTDTSTSSRFEVSKGLGIYLYVMDPATGFLSPRKAFDVGNTNPSSLVISPNGKNLYAVNEISNF